MATPSIHLYVYYRVKAAYRAEWRQAVTAMQAALAPLCHQVRLTQRRDDKATCMESYEGISEVPQFLDTLNQHLQQAAWRIWLEGKGNEAGQRHEEWFEDCNES